MLDIVLYALCLIVDGRSPQRANEVETRRRTGGVDVGTASLGQLHSHLADPTCAAMNQHTLTGTDIGTIYQTFPCGNEYQRQCSRLTHAESGRL
ncbi:hypothetical protein D3C76_979340 [compost metagenome]